MPSPRSVQRVLETWIDTQIEGSASAWGISSYGWHRHFANVAWCTSGLTGTNYVMSLDLAGPVSITGC